MTAPVYATVEDLAAEPWALTPPPAGAERMLAAASRLVRRATMLARYPVATATGLPLDSEITDALRQATCAQVVAWTAAKLDPSTGGYQPSGAVLQSRKLASAALTYDTSAATSVTALNARAAAGVTLTSDALQILIDAGLTGHRPGTYR